MADAASLARRPPRWFRAVDRASRIAIMWLTCVFLVLMVAFTIYTVVMRYVFHDPPFWGDTVALFCNIWFVLVAYALAVRDREDIASEFAYEYLPPKAVSALHYCWQLLTLSFGLFLVVFGAQAALDVPGQYWELGGLPKQVPMMVLPIAGVLVALMSAITIAEDALGWRAADRERVQLPASPCATGQK
jgi:TRAP-type C4-dicarboxylate transport system permease small subunit